MTTLKTIVQIIGVVGTIIEVVAKISEEINKNK